MFQTGKAGLRKVQRERGREAGTRNICFLKKTLTFSMVANSPSKKCPTLAPPLHSYYPRGAPLLPTLDVTAKTINQNPEQ